MMRTDVNPMSDEAGTTFTEKVRIMAHWRSGRRERMRDAEARLLPRLEDPEYAEEFPGRVARAKQRLADFAAEHRKIQEGMSIASEDVMTAAVSYLNAQGIKVVE